MADEDVSESFSEWQKIPSPSSPTGNNDTQDLPISDTQIAATEISTLPLTNTGIHEKGEGNKWLKKNLRELRCWIVQVASKIRNYAACKVGIGTFTCNRTRLLTLLLVSLFYWTIQKQWRRQRQLDTSKKFVLLIQEKDKKIYELLVQINQMKHSSLVARRNVPVLRVG